MGRGGHDTQLSRDGVWCGVWWHDFGWVALQNAESFVVQAYPVKLEIMDLLNVFITLLVLGLVTAIYPASKAAAIVAQEMKK
jgi:ABC-type lipoprotein release transport system permease subunit